MIAEYRDLVQASPSDQALRRTLDLAEEVWRFQVDLSDVRARLQELDQAEASQDALRRTASEDLIDFLHQDLEEESLRRVRKRQLVQLQELALRASGAFSFPSVHRRHGPELSVQRSSLGVDVLLVLFHQVYFGLLDKLESLPAERAMLLHSGLRYSEFLPYPDRCRIHALVRDAQGEPDQAAFFYEEALRASSPASDEFMTVLQTAWSHAMEYGMFFRAFALLFQTAPRISDSDLPEFKELVLATIDAFRSNSANKSHT